MGPTPAPSTWTLGFPVPLKPAPSSSPSCPMPNLLPCLSGGTGLSLWHELHLDLVFHGSCRWSRVAVGQAEHMALGSTGTAGGLQQTPPAQRGFGGRQEVTLLPAEGLVCGGAGGIQGALGRHNLSAISGVLLPGEAQQVCRQRGAGLPNISELNGGA